MLILGAKGFAKEVLEIFHQLETLENLAFYDGMNTYTEKKLYDRFPILTSDDELTAFFQTDKRFVLGIGNPSARKKLAQKTELLGGELSSVISPYSVIGHYGTSIQKGCNIMSGTIITNDVSIHKGVLINLNCTIGHDTVIGEFSELCPGVNVSGNVQIGSEVFIGTNSVIAPSVQIGDGAVIGAGSVVLKDVPPGTFWAGNPAKFIRDL